MSYVLDPATVIEERGPWVLAVNRNQNLLGKTMLVLDRPCVAVTDLDQGEWISLQTEIGRITNAIAALFGPDQFNYAFLMNVDAQVHLHVIPRYASSRIWRGQEFVDANWGSPFDTNQRLLRPDDLVALTDELRAVMSGS